MGAVLYYFLPGPIITQNLTWIFLTFATMCTPLLIAFIVLLAERRHRNLGVSSRGLTETQLLFSPARRFDSSRHRRRTRNRNRRRSSGSTSSTCHSPWCWWRRVRGGGSCQCFFPWDSSCLSCLQLPRSYRRFLWFCAALLLSLIGFVLGEVYAELYLRTLPHSALETVVYVYSWVATIHILDATTGWILGAKVGSLPLGWLFKLYFSLTYQTYVRALYARLRSPSQFVYLQLLSSAIVVLWNPLTMTASFYRLLVRLGCCGRGPQHDNDDDYAEWQRGVGRAFFIRGLAESVSMVAFLGWVVGLHFGWNRDVYPYFNFRDGRASASGDEYTFALTFWASLATWACELVAGWIVRRLMSFCFGFCVTEQALADFRAFPELLPTCL